MTLTYSAGLSGQEVVNLKISDVDFERIPEKSGQAVTTAQSPIYCHTVFILFIMKPTFSN
ncbi:MAG: hypothetical protein FD181_1991 [Prolixibacteraceae bacterium]|nr:MAG: hypothetical protein FD181_1991 [Prolixibacteraceae bacterium]